MGEGRIRRDTDGIVLASVIAHDMGAPVIKVPVPAVGRGPNASTPWPVWSPASACPSSSSVARARRPAAHHVLDEVRDVMHGGGAGMAMGRTIYQDPDPAEVAGLVHGLVHGR